jgi:hypothetical protein
MQPKHRASAGEALSTDGFERLLPTRGAPFTVAEDARRADPGLATTQNPGMSDKVEGSVDMETDAPAPVAASSVIADIPANKLKRMCTEPPVGHTISKFVENVYCINLRHRVDRLSSARATIADLDSELIFTRIGAIYDELNPRSGCALSHVMAIEQAARANLNSVLVVEDDICFADDANSVLSKQISTVPLTWDLLILGSYYTTTIALLTGWNDIKYFQGAHAIIYSSSSFNIVSSYSGIPEAYDEFLAIQLGKGRLRGFLCHPGIAFQRASFSDIKGHYFDPNRPDDPYKADHLLQEEAYRLMRRGDIAQAAAISCRVVDDRIRDTLNKLMAHRLWESHHD